MFKRKATTVNRQSHGATIPVPPVFRRLTLLWLILIGIALAIKPYDSTLSLSVLWGVTVNLAPAVCFAWYVFRIRGASKVRQTVNAFYRGEAAKYLMTVFLFAVVFVQVDKINVLAFFLSVITAQILSWLVSGLTIGQR